MPPTKVKLSNCSKEALFKAVMDVNRNMRFKTVRDMHRRQNSISIVAIISEYYVPKNGDTIKLSKAGNPIFKDWLPEHFCHKKQTWEEAGIAKGYLSTKTNYDPTFDSDEPILQTMTGIPIDIQDPVFIARIQEFTAYPGSCQLETQNAIQSVIDEYIDDDTFSERKNSGPLPAVYNLQRVKIILQNKLFSAKAQIEEKLNSVSGKIITNNKSFIAWRQELELLMAMHERANGLSPRERPTSQQ
jgi:hypothetical protein